ncbi:MAG: pyridoxamine 5'-phosphate oxidase family protein [Aulosira sp. DedQUE10]|nr:pyridoxamine 5'-phosphate oxidase family protein [Aulosira sp. DedQUE10]
MLEPANSTNRWVNTIDSQNPEVIAQASGIIANNLYCTLSTCSADGYPWVSPLFFAYDDHWNIYWSSAIISQHSQNIYNNHGRVAIAIFDSSISEGTAEGVYITGTASELNPDAAEKVLQLLLQRATKKYNRTALDYLNDSPRRFYQCQPQEVWITGKRVAIGNQLVDTKIQLSLLSLINAKFIEQ